MLVEELERKLGEVEAQIGQIEKRINPMQEELRRLREYRQHVLGLLQFEQGDSSSAPMAPVDFPRKPSRVPYWKRIADERGYYVGGDSAHRVVIRENPELHLSITHQCDYDGRQYP